MKSTVGLCVLIFAVTLTIFMISRVHQVTDSTYSMALSQSLLDHHSFTLDHYKLAPTYQLEVVNGHTYYRFPPGTPVLSAPFVWILNRLGVAAVNADGTYNPRGEVMIEAGMAAMLMALLAVIFFLTARLLIPTGWSLVVAFGAALGTQVYSTASRALWSETWGIFLLGITILLLLRHEIKQRPLSPFLFASLLSWTYFVRPTYAVSIAAITIYILIFHRSLFIPFAITGAAWLGGFIAYSRYHFGTFTPSYYQANRLLFTSFWTGLAGNLISPARGLFIYVPALLFVGYLLFRYHRFIAYWRLVWLSLAVVVVHLTVISGFPHWWGGHSFGPRFTTGLVPWLVMLAIIGISAMLKSRQRERSDSSLGWKMQLTCGGLLLLMSVVINTLGATSHATWLWNMRPKGVDEHPERLWDWRQPQFLAAYLPYPRPAQFPLVGVGSIDFTKPEANQYFWYGWNEGPPDQRWTEAKAAMVFAIGDIRPTAIRLNLTPYLVPGKLQQQRVIISLNGRTITTFTLDSSAPSLQTMTIPDEVLKEKNILIFELPDAQSPQKLGAEVDPRPRGIKLNWVEFVTD